MSTNNMNSSALSDDGNLNDKFSTRALRGFAPVSESADDGFNFEQPNRPQQEGISTHADISDGGSRHAGRVFGDADVIPEDVEQDDESARTGPAGTIGEKQDCVSENIESNMVHRLRKGGNQSAKGGNFTRDKVIRGQTAQVFEQDESSMSQMASFAVIREKIALRGSNVQVRNFSSTYD